MGRLTNTELGELLDMSHVHVHRIRYGSRLPSVDAMVRIETVLGWKVSEQVDARTAGTYAKEFERAAERYASRRDTTAGLGRRPRDPQ